MRLLKGKKALSTVVTTLIILVVSVLLATVVTFYAINVTTTRVQEESLHLTKFHVWYNPTGEWSEAAFVIINTGGKDVVIDKITVRGQECPWNNVYYWKTSGAITSDLKPTSTKPSGNSVNIVVDGQPRSFSNATVALNGNDLTLMSGQTVVIYIVNPDSISVNDIGVTVGLTVFTSNAQYYKEANVEST
ncbi:MAG: hypothetical protein QXR89_04850 [Candidatus Bathyarchaeia archaeon]